MDKHKRKLPDRRSAEIANSHFAEWERVEDEIRSNRDLRGKIRALRERYGLPCTTPEAHRDWIRKQGLDMEFQLQDDLDALAKKYRHGDKGKRTILSLAYYGRVVQWKEATTGFPSLISVIEGDRFLGWDLKITPEVDIDNPLVMEFILQVRRETLLKRNPPPIPQTVKNHPHHKKDWRPLREWAQRYPWVTTKEIASMIDKRHGYVKTKLGKLGRK